MSLKEEKLKARPRPYYDTEVTPEKSKLGIEQLLKTYGIKDLQWTTYQGQTELKFIYKLQIRGMEKEIAFGFRPPVILIPRRTWNQKNSRYEKVNVPHEAMAMRLLWHYLKTKLEAVSWGLESMEKEFLSHAIVALPTGQETTVGEQIEAVLQAVQSPSLIYKPLASDKTIDATPEAHEKGEGQG